MNRKLFTILVLTILIAAPIFAQINSFNANSLRVDVDFVSPQNYSEKEKAQGSPYVTENFILAKINNSSEIYGVRYDAYQDLMEVQKGNESKTLLLDKQRDYVVIINDGSNKTYQTVSYENGERGFAILLWTNDTQGLYAREKVKYTPERPASNGYEADLPAIFSKNKNIYYIKDSENGDLIELSPSKKKFYDVFKSKSKEVQNFAKKEKLKISKQKDLEEIIRYYFSLE